MGYRIGQKPVLDDTTASDGRSTTGDDDFEDCSWKDLLRSARDKENDLPEADANCDEAGDSDFEDFSWKELLGQTLILSRHT